MIFAREKMDTARPSVVTLTRRVSIEKISDGIFFFLLLLLFFFFWSTRASLSLECGACIYTSLMEREEGETLEDPMAERADPLGRRQATTRKQGSTLSRVPGPVRNNDTPPSREYSRLGFSVFGSHVAAALPTVTR